jgi:hypothetical protein
VGVGDDNDDTPSILDDDATLAVEEYIVLLFIEARQSDLYSLHSNDKRRIFEEVLKRQPEHRSTVGAHVALRRDRPHVLKGIESA